MRMDTDESFFKPEIDRSGRSDVFLFHASGVVVRRVFSDVDTISRCLPNFGADDFAVASRQCFSFFSIFTIPKLDSSAHSEVVMR